MASTFLLDAGPVGILCHSNPARRAALRNWLQHQIAAGSIIYLPEIADYDAFVRLIRRASRRLPMRLLGFCLMPNHFHLALWPVGDGDLSDWMGCLLTAEARRHHKAFRGSRHVWQGRFKTRPGLRI